jgi:hypothetical protein
MFVCEKINATTNEECKTAENVYFGNSVYSVLRHPFSTFVVAFGFRIKRRRYVPPKSCTTTRPHGITTQKTTIDFFTAARTSILFPLVLLL